MPTPLNQRGVFKAVKDETITSVYSLLKQLQEVLENDEATASCASDNALNLINDHMIGRHLGFNLVNCSKHGFDCLRESDGALLESKVASFTAKQWTATFNDTNIEKANEFKQPNVYLALSVWKNNDTPLFILWGQNPAIGDFLELRVKNRKEGSRSTQSISAKKLYKTYGFKFVVPEESLVDFNKYAAPVFGGISHEDITIV